MVGHDLQVLLVKLEQILHLQVDFGQGHRNYFEVGGQRLPGSEVTPT